MSTTIATIADSNTGTNVDVIQADDGSVTFVAGADLDGDGGNGQAGHSPCYAPASYNGPTLDVMGNAGVPGNWWGVVTDNGQANGTPAVQGANDPAPGAYVSTTALNLPGSNGQELPDHSPFKYVDSATVPYISLPEIVIQKASGVVVGCRCVVTNTENGAAVVAVVADSGDNSHIGEISVACAKALGLPVGNPHEADGGRHESTGDSLPVLSRHGGDGERRHLPITGELIGEALGSDRIRSGTPADFASAGSNREIPACVRRWE